MKASRIAAGALLCACASTAAFAQKPSKADQKAAQAAAQAQQQENTTVFQLADAAMTGQAASDFPIQFQNDFLRSAGGRVWVPITLTLDPAKVSGGPMTMYVRLAPRGMTPPPPSADKKKKDDKKDDKKNAPAAPEYPVSEILQLDLKPAAPGQPIRFARGLSLMPGSYDLYVVMHERAASGAGKASVLKQALDVPNYSGGEFTSSTVLLAKRVDQLPAPLPPDQQTERPYAFGANEIIIAPDHKFAKTEELLVLLQVYNPSVSADRKFNLEATYTFFRLEAGAEKRFNSTEPQQITSETVPGVDPTGPAGVPAGQGIPLQTFPDGAYRLEIKITDKLDKLNPKVLTKSVNFTVTP